MHPAKFARLMRVAIIGRPNVGKSSLFNRLIGRQHALVYNKPGVTRDCLFEKAEYGGFTFEVVDTAGLDDGVDMQEDEAEMRKAGPQMKASGIGRWPAHLLTEALENTSLVVKSSDLVLFMVDQRVGLTPLDWQFARWLAMKNKPTLLISNKADGNVSPLDENLANISVTGMKDVKKLGLGEPLHISATQNEGMSELIMHMAPIIMGVDRKNRQISTEWKSEEERRLRLLILGRPNVGKSTLVNALVETQADEKKEDFVPLLVGPEPGITRDPVSVIFEHQGQQIEVIDTAGLRKKGKTMQHGDAIDIKTSYASLKRVPRADLVILLLEINKQTGLLTEQDITLATEVIKEGKAILVAVNKCDTLSKEELANVKKSSPRILNMCFNQLGEVPTVFISSQNRLGLKQLMTEAISLHEKSRTKLSTADLQRWVHDIKRIGKMSPPTFPNLKFARQVDTKPPTIVLTCSRSVRSTTAYMAYLTNDFRRTFGLDGVPLRILLREELSQAKKQ
ncbi:hypothetical protein GUITHDRAFT_163859 [Guillardia theta CCMP2712]|uniref:GTPase Der n=1 Tax=Guillardia theta (strain CCMP2712) TaxID=905079 RepID=L1J577_GUITC|nr:hypothetical protein GUITHDRAFT_163859 [Guillardia theta CCMP2712]EKX43482.1 hypothetical protein GUITHDRAFT_163859 [Guillardia theta CCMP2712]|eukprot:XP_005830462.1 hypothetical protein GUITHDRAFT_163859 [Guillardia theta CCMP2712]